MFEQFAYLFLILAAGWCDLKTRTVPDILTALLWLILVFPPFSITSAAYAFAVVYALVAGYEFVKREQVLGLADILALPTWYSAICTLSPLGTGISAACLVLTLAVSPRFMAKKTTLPGVALFALSFACGLILPMLIR